MPRRPSPRCIAQANDLLPGARKSLQARVRALRGHPVVVNVWAAWCGPCRVELPVVQSASLDWGKRVAFLGVDLRDNRGSAKKLLSQIPLTYPSYEDPDGKVYNGYRLIGTPSTVYYDAAGKQTYIHTGPYQDRAQFDADIKRYARRDRGPPRARSVRDRRRAGAALRRLLRRAGRQPGRGARRARRRRAAARRGRRTARSSAPAACWPRAPRSSSGAWRSRPGTAVAALAAELLVEAEAQARELGAQRIALAAQLGARTLYERAGYAPYGDVFLDAGIEHVMMGKALE